MADIGQTFTALGIYMRGYDLERLEWAIDTIRIPIQLAAFVEPLRICERVTPFKDIGDEAKACHDMLSNHKDPQLSDRTRDTLRDQRARWDTLIRERLADLYLVTPQSVISPKKLMDGISGFLNQQLFSLLRPIEISDLNEACKCILIGSATAAEHIALRAAESLLRRWYECKTQKKLTRGTWGTVLDRLVNEYPENCRPKEIALLGYLKQRRDEVAHPDRISKLTEAESTLMNVTGLLDGIGPILTPESNAPAKQKPPTNNK